jgi:hypothetical protein
MTRPKVLSQLAAGIVSVTRSPPLTAFINIVKNAIKEEQILPKDTTRIRSITILPSALKANGSA